MITHEDAISFLVKGGCAWLEDELRKNCGAPASSSVTPHPMNVIHPSPSDSFFQFFYSPLEVAQWPGIAAKIKMLPTIFSESLVALAELLFMHPGPRNLLAFYSQRLKCPFFSKHIHTLLGRFCISLGHHILECLSFTWRV